MTRQREASPKGEVFYINKLHKDFPGEWVALRITLYHDKSPAAGTLLSHSREGSTVMEAVTEARRDGEEEIGVYGGVERADADSSSQPSELEALRVVEHYVERAELELMPHRAPEQSLAEFAAGLVSKHRQEAHRLLSEARTNYTEVGHLRRHEGERREYSLLVMAAILLAARQDSSGLVVLGGLLVTEELNRKLMIIDFLGALTQNQIGQTTPYLPDKERILQWCKALLHLARET